MVTEWGMSEAVGPMSSPIKAVFLGEDMMQSKNFRGQPRSLSTTRSAGSS